MFSPRLFPSRWVGGSLPVAAVYSAFAPPSLAAMPNRFITHVAEGDLGRSFHVAAASHRLQFRLPHPHILLMTSWKPTPRAPAKTKEELREMLAQAVRNTQPETKPLPKAKKGRR